jgi:hypothetical protein
MTVRDLIKKLKAIDQDAEVITTSSNFELGSALVPVSYVHVYKEGKEQTKTFRDAFDGESYDKKVWSLSGGKTTVVTIN